ncbi:MAG: Type 1 glutamine amidotransferase-like domain-containing protein [Opitutaceae bacterium]|nr:Type 1 glutamine amidotransferase-like domain-containing protein [Opitutaceae bacterium]
MKTNSWIAGLTCLILATAAVAAPAAKFFTNEKASVLVCGGSMMNGNHFSDSSLAIMREHYAGCRKIALVLHPSLPRDRDRMEARLKEAFAHLGPFEVESLHHRDAKGQIALLKSADGIFVGGGETFVLLAELYRTGQLQVLRERTLAGIPYCGTSAGANVAGLLIGTTNDFPVADIPTRNALGIFPAVINPHHPAPAEKAEFAGRSGKIKGYLAFNPGESVLALGNASFARLYKGHVTFSVGLGWLYREGSVRALSPGDSIDELIGREKSTVAK